MENKHFLELLKNYDFEAMSRAYRESEIAWSAKEWKEFIEKIVEERDEYWIKVAERMKKNSNPDDEILETSEGEREIKKEFLGIPTLFYNTALSDLITRIKNNKP